MLEFSGARKWASIESIVLDLDGQGNEATESKLRVAETLLGVHGPAAGVT